MNNSFDEIYRRISKAKRVLILCHKKPDLDTLGSAVAFKRFLELINVSSKIFCVDKVNENYLFLEGITEVSNDINLFQEEFDLFVCLDLGASSMFGLEEKILNIIFSKFLINIDHHSSNTFFGNYNYIDTNASSTTVIIFDFFNSQNIEIDSLMATCLLTGLYSDTGCFKHSNTDSRAFEIASELMNKGAVLSDSIKKVFNFKSFNNLKIWSKVFENIFLTDSNVLISYLKSKDFVTTGTSPSDLAGVIEYLNMVPDVKYSVLLNETNDGFLKGSLRTKNPKMNLSKIAEKLGGGGHPGASGFVLKAKASDDKKLTIFSSDLSKILLSF